MKIDFVSRKKCNINLFTFKFSIFFLLRNNTQGIGGKFSVFRSLVSVNVERAHTLRSRYCFLLCCLKILSIFIMFGGKTHKQLINHVLFSFFFFWKRNKLLSCISFRKKGILIKQTQFWNSKLDGNLFRDGFLGFLKLLSMLVA